MNSSNRYALPFIGTVLIVIGIFIGLVLSGPGKGLSGSTGQYEKKLSDVLNILENEYVDSIDKEKLFEETISEMLHRLDPHSNYIPARDLKAMSESIEGKFGGVGVRFAIIRDTLSVTNVIRNAPADRAGIKKYDQIITVEGENVANVQLTNQKVQDLLKGEAGTDVKIEVLRGKQRLIRTITRGMVPIESVSAAFMIDENTGYIKLNQFSIQSDAEFYRAALDLKRKGMKKLIFDLRYNGGGVMGSAVNIIDAFLEKGLPIVSTKGKNSPKETLYSQTTPALGDVELVILINESSASASEIVAGAIQDNDRGTIIGRRSFGKGLVQQDMQLKDGSNLRLTVSRYYTPTGRCIQKEYKGDYEEYMMDEYNRYESGELYKVDSSLFVDSLKYYTPAGKVVYGGGGIMPDVFVPLDTTGSSVYLRRLRYANVFADFAYDFARKQNRSLQWNDFKEFNKNFQVDEKLLKAFTEYAKTEAKISLNQAEFSQSKERIKENIKAEIARQFWLEDGAYYVLFKNDPEIIKALQTLK
ncbi:MAG: S41 family peptidase [Brumimicrobium sp.]|nr:S41 family peptidase [Brumimicrobium sp.]